jgi:hypothetical protein
MSDSVPHCLSLTGPLYAQVDDLFSAKKSAARTPPPTPTEASSRTATRSGAGIHPEYAKLAEERLKAATERIVQLESGMLLTTPLLPRLQLPDLI